jgi:hypothetical protein
MTLEQLFRSFSSTADFIDAVDAKLIELAKEKPDFEYRGYGPCYYHRGRMQYGARVNVECDGCIFGQAFQRLGVEKENLNVTGTINEILWEYMTTPTYWADIQSRQDRGEKWSDAIKPLFVE